MRWDEWRFSATRAWQDRVVRWMTLVTALFDTIIAGLFMSRIVPLTRGSGMVTFHYNIYLGIDDVRPWHWVFLPTGVMLGVYVLNTLFAYGVYRYDRVASRALASLTAAISILWAVTLYFFVTINR